MKRISAVFFSSIVVLVLAVGTVFADEGTLRMYVAYSHPELIASEFEKATGIKVEFLPMSSGEVLTRLKAERSNPRTDVWFGGGSDAFIQAKADGLIVPYDSPNAKRVADAFRDGEGYWTGVSLVVVGLLVNTERAESVGLPIPDSWEAIADSSFKDEVLASNPKTSGTAYTTVSGVLQMFGEEKGWSYLERLYGNIPFLEKSGGTPGTKAVQGEFAVGIVPDPHSIKMNNPDAPVKTVFPKDGVLAWPSPVAIVKGAKNMEGAEKFVDWALSPEGQKVLMRANPRVPTTDVEPLEGVPRLKDLNLIPYDHVKWGTSRADVLAEFSKLFPQFN
ncbi:ABC transporter substrate-binding protein [Dethiosulfovibrio sp. F2B]|uniref:ABC transporter substrate-binding protein n=1 Tax=Dethiosulfovibrio faecalis TaxID=2720018 RepID=UPI001F40D8E2|nr:ABC transporter substrate-binding protein [Dethiosulfovibrio faecalis]MCF4151331.1 ABC transporter substrate-binding protein [Dethiosulfovibrio faecalis]